MNLSFSQYIPQRVQNFLGIKPSQRAYTEDHAAGLMPFYIPSTDVIGVPEDVTKHSFQARMYTRVGESDVFTPVSSIGGFGGGNIYSNWTPANVAYLPDETIRLIDIQA